MEYIGIIAPILFICAFIFTLWTCLKAASNCDDDMGYDDEPNDE